MLREMNREVSASLPVCSENVNTCDQMTFRGLAVGAGAFSSSPNERSQLKLSSEIRQPYRRSASRAV